LQLREQPRANLCRAGPDVFPVEPQQLLAVAHDAQLARGVASGQLDHAARIDAGGSAQLEELLGGGILAAHPGNTDACAEDGDLPRDVGGSAKPAFAPLCAHHRHRRFGRDALDRAGEVLIDHQVTDDPDVEVGEAIREREQRAHVRLGAHARSWAPSNASSASQIT